MNEASAAPPKVCAACAGRYPSDALFCPTDGTPLQSAAAAERDADDAYLGQEISGHIEIRQIVGVGAMGRVYRAFQRGIDRDVAVKILHRELSANAQLVSRFTREAKVASRLQHPNVVQVLLAGQLPDRALYMVMEYLDGLSLQSALAASGGALPLPRALHIALQLCEAVGEAHAQGIVHRDLKPENVMLVRRGSDHDFVKVLDFGIARINWGEQSVATAAGLIFGTARYISPEGAQGNTVGPPSDVYSIGTLLYQMLAGRTPFDGDQAVGLLVQQIHDPPPPLRSIPRAAYVPEPICDVIMASLSKDASKRESDARSFGQAIFDAAKLAGLSPDEFSRPLRRKPSSIQLPPVERTKQHELTPDLVERMTPPAPNAANGASAAPRDPKDLGGRVPTAATVKWEPPSEFQARLAAVPRAPLPTGPALETERTPGRVTAGVESTIDDMLLEAGSSPAFPATAPSPAHPSPGPGRVSTPSVPRTVPGDAETPVRTHFSTPIDPVVPAPARRVSDAELAPAADEVREARKPRGLLVVVACFLLGVLIAAGWAWRTGRLGATATLEGEEERFVVRATNAMFQKHFSEPAFDNVKEITDEGLKRYPSSRRLQDVRVRAASELTSQAMTQRSNGDVLEALRLAKLAHELDRADPAAKRLIDQYEGELASFSPSAAPTLARPPDRPGPMPTTKPGPGPAPAPAPGPPVRVDYKALVDVAPTAPKLGQPIDITARIAPGKGNFEQPAFTVSGPGVPGGVRMTALGAGPGLYKASYAFLEPGRFEVLFTTQVDGKAISAKRQVEAGGPAPAPSPSPTPPPSPSPTPSASVKWM